jgi:hypothetical protein
MISKISMAAAPGITSKLQKIIKTINSHPPPSPSSYSIPKLLKKVRTKADVSLSINLYRMPMAQSLRINPGIVHQF